MKQVPIKRAIERVPGGLMVVPLLTGAMFATFFPAMPQFFGSFTGALFTGALPILAVFFATSPSEFALRVQGVAGTSDTSWAGFETDQPSG